MNTSAQSTQNSTVSLSQKTDKDNNGAMSNTSNTGGDPAAYEDKKLLARIQDLVEYYFRPLDQSRDMIKKLKEGDGFVSLDAILSFSELKQICEEQKLEGFDAHVLLYRALGLSEYVEFSEDGKSIGPTQIENTQVLWDLRKQVKYCLLPKNLSRNHYLQKQLEEGGGTVPLDLLCRFKSIRRIHAEGCLGFPPNFPEHFGYPVANPAVLRRALQGYKSLRLAESGWRVGPLPGAKMEDTAKQAPPRPKGNRAPIRSQCRWMALETTTEENAKQTPRRPKDSHAPVQNQGRWADLETNTEESAKQPRHRSNGNRKDNSKKTSHDLRRPGQGSNLLDWIEAKMD